MKLSGSKFVTTAAAIALAACSSLAVASRVPPNMVSGTVSAVNGTQIVVNGQTYNVKVDGPAFRALQGVQVGQRVDLVLNGSPHTAASQVIGINVRTGR
jgi:hypothetical protein